MRETNQRSVKREWELVQIRVGGHRERKRRGWIKRRWIASRNMAGCWTQYFFFFKSKKKIKTDTNCNQQQSENTDWQWLIFYPDAIFYLWFFFHVRTIREKRKRYRVKENIIFKFIIWSIVNHFSCLISQYLKFSCLSLQLNTVID